MRRRNSGTAAAVAILLIGLAVTVSMAREMFGHHRDTPVLVAFRINP